MKLEEIGEFGLIERFKPLFSGFSEGYDKPLGIGDDCAVIPAGAEDFLFTTDMLMDGIHFILSEVDGFMLGWKSLAVSVSDVAAMGGSGVGSFLSIAIPDGLDVEFIDEFMRGYKSCSDKFGIPLLGGDTTRSASGLAINVGVLGKCAHGAAVLRSGARVGDAVCVTGCLGDSAAGLKLVLNHKASSVSDDAGRYLLDRHYLPMPRVDEGSFLADSGVHSMMDISDGVASDLRHIMKSSSVGAEIDLDLVPLSDELKQYSSVMEYDPVSLALTGGEDYELLFTMSSDAFNMLNASFMDRFGHKIYRIGTITGNIAYVDHSVKGKSIIHDPSVRWLKGGHPSVFSENGFDHFKSSK